MGLIPSSINSGVNFRVLIEQPLYPAPDWSFSLIARGAGRVDLVAVAEGRSHVFQANADETSAWTPGRYRYEIRAQSGGDVFTVEAGDFVIAADLAAQSEGYDPRGHARKVLDAIEAVIEGRASLDQQSYVIGNRSLQRTPIGDLIKLRTVYRAEVAAAKAAKNGRGFGRILKVRMR